MADNVVANPGVGGATFAADEGAGSVYWPYAKLAWGADNTQTVVAAGASAVPIQDGGNTITVDGTVTVNAGTNLNTSALALEATLGDVVTATEAIRAAVEAPLTVNVGLTDAQLRATPVPVSGTVAVTNASLTAMAASLDILDDWDESDRAKVNIIVGQAGVAGGTGTDAATVLRVSLATNVPLPAGTNGIGKLTANSGVDIGDVDVASIAAGDNNIGNVDVVTLPALVAGSANIGDVDVLTIAAGTTLIGDVALAPRTSGGCSILKSLDVDETEDEIKGSAGQIYGYFFFNAHASALRYLKFYDATAAGTTVGSTVPIFTMPIVAQTAGHISFATPIACANGISIAATTGLADADTGAPGANEVVAWVEYK